MANHAVIQLNKVAAKNQDSLNRPVISASNVDNGNIFQLLSVSGTTGEGEVFVATAPTTASSTGVWMAAQPEQPFGSAGNNVYYGIGNIQDFYNSASQVFQAFKPEKGDIIELSVDAFDTTPTAGQYAIPSSGVYTMAWAAAAGTGFALKYLNSSYIPCASASAISAGRITTYRCEVTGV